MLAEIAAEVYSVERIDELARRASSVLAELGYSNVQVHCGDGARGWPAHAPYDAITVTAGAASAAQDWRAVSHARRPYAWVAAANVRYPNRRTQLQAGVSR